MDTSTAVVSHPGLWDGFVVNAIDKRPNDVEELDDAGPYFEIQDSEIQKAMYKLIEEEEEEQHQQRAGAEEQPDGDAGPRVVDDPRGGKGGEQQQLNGEAGAEEEEEESSSSSDEEDNSIEFKEEEGEEEVDYRKASLWYFIIYEEIQNLARHTLFWTHLQEDMWRKRWIKNAVIESVKMGTDRMTRDELMKNLLAILDEEFLEPQEVVRAIMQCGVPVLGKGLRRCWVEIHDLLRRNKSVFLPVIKDWISKNTPVLLALNGENVDASAFADFMLSADDFHLSLILCGMNEIIVNKHAETPLVSVKLLELFAMARLYYSLCFEGGLSFYHHFSLWVPRCLSHSCEDTGAEPAQRGIKLTQNAEGKVRAVATFSAAGTSVPIVVDELEWCKTTMQHQKEEIEKQKKIIEKLKRGMVA